MRLTAQSASRDKGKKPNPRHAPLRERLCQVFLEQRDTPYLWQEAKDAEALNALIAAATDQEILKRWQAGLGHRDTDFKHCNTVAQLRSKWNDLAANKQQPVGGDEERAALFARLSGSAGGP